MRRYDFNLEILISIIGALLSLSGFVLDNYYIVSFGVIAILIYTYSYVKKNIFEKIKNNERLLKNITKDINTHKEINELKAKISFLEGVQSMMKNKKGFLDPISLVIVVILLVLLVMFLRSKGLF